MFVVTNICCDKSFVTTKNILVAVPANDVLQLRTSCAGVLHRRSLPTYFKLLYLLNHSVTHPVLLICRIHQFKDSKMEHEMGWFILRLKFDFDFIELMECTCSVFFCIICFQFTHGNVDRENLKLNHCHCQQQVHSVTDHP